MVSDVKRQASGLVRHAPRGAITLVAVVFASPLAAQIVEYSGYVENTLQADYTQEAKGQVLDASKVRFDVGGAPFRGLEIQGNVNLIVALGARSRRLSPYLPDAVAREMAAIGVPDTFSVDRARFFVDNLFVTWSTGGLRVRAGKQQLSWGPAYSFNPTDLFHRKDLLDPTYEKEGVTALRLDYRWGLGGQASVIAAPKKDIDRTGYALRVGTHVNAIGYDVALTVHRVTDSTALRPSTLEPYTQRRHAVGVGLSGELLGLGVWLEGNWNALDDEADFVRAVLGIDYTLNDGTYLLAEALYNGRSPADAPYPLHDWLANVLYGEPVGSGWMLAGVRRDLSDLVLGSLYVFVALDGSFVVNPRIDASLAQNLDLVVFGGLTLGNADGVFPPGLYSGIARATLYF